MKTIISITPNQLVFTRNEELFTSSLVIAQQFEKDHQNVLKAIRSLECSDHFKEVNFNSSFYISTLHNGGQKKNPLFEMTKDGFMFLVMGFTGKKAGLIKEAFINEFNIRGKELEKSRLNEEILASYISTKVDKSIADLNEHRRQLAKEFKGGKPSSSGIRPTKWSDSLDFKSNLDNLLSSYQRVIAEGNYYYAKHNSLYGDHQHLKFKIMMLGNGIARLEF